MNNVDSITSHTQSDTNDVAQDTSAVIAVEVIPDSLSTTATDEGGGGSWIGWVDLGLIACMGYLIFKIMKQLKELRVKSDMQDKILKESEQLIMTLQKEMESLRNVKRTIAQSAQNPVAQKVTPSQPVDKNKAYKPQKKEEPKGMITTVKVKYATLQSPNEKGEVRFAQRSMVDTSSSSKMFVLYIDEQSGTGTYKINPEAMDMILSDLQVFKDFVKPFKFNGDLTRAKIVDKKPGAIVKQGDYWVVSELLEININ